MLLFDWVQQTAWNPPAHLAREGREHGLVLRKMAELIRGSQVFVLDNIAPYLHERFGTLQETETDWQDIAPGARTPFDRMWIEWSLGGVKQAPFRDWQRLGVLLRSRSVDELRQQEIKVPTSAEYFWQPRIAVWPSQSSLPLWPPATHRAFADREGTVFCVGRIAGPNAFGDYFTFCTLAIALMAVAFLNTRNVDQKVHNAPGLGLERKNEGGSRETIFRTLHIKPTRASRMSTVETDEEAHLRSHLVRGRWRVFTPERPMSGRPGFHGRYWIEPHPRGDREFGSVEKPCAVHGLDEEGE